MYEQIFTYQAKILKALAHSRRLEIVQLIQNSEMHVTDIHQMLDLPQANVSQHLLILKQAKILKIRKDGKQIYYSIASPVFLEMIAALRSHLIDIHNNSPMANEFTLSMNDLVPVTHDPVCNMRVSPKTAGFAHTHNGTNFYFCASGCLKAFIKKPENYVNSKRD